jgi:PhzF family phenazine biosynthesis protein
MQQVAGEMNLSETAFVVPEQGAFGLRWFTPTVEVDLCGHATLASAHALWEAGRAERNQPVRFSTRSGLLTCTADPAGQIAMDFPAESPTPAPVPEGLIEVLGMTPVSVARNRFDLLVELGSEAEVRRVQPDIAALLRIPCRGMIVTARSDNRDYDFVSRFFAPAVGVDEDPVCGSAHCCLGPYWRDRLGRTRLRGAQVSARTGDIGVEMVEQRVMLRGRACTTMSGNLLVSPD